MEKAESAPAQDPSTDLEAVEHEAQIGRMVHAAQQLAAQLAERARGREVAQEVVAAVVYRACARSVLGSWVKTTRDAVIHKET